MLELARLADPLDDRVAFDEWEGGREGGREATVSCTPSSEPRLLGQKVL